METITPVLTSPKPSHQLNETMIFMTKNSLLLSWLWTSGDNIFEAPPIQSLLSPITKTCLILKIPENYPTDKLVGPYFYRTLISIGRSHLALGWHLLMTMLMLPLSQTQWSSKPMTSPSRTISSPLPLLISLF